MLVFVHLIFQPPVFWWYLIISESVKYVILLDIIVTYIKENIIRKFQKKSSVLFLKKHLCTDHLSLTHKIFIERPELPTTNIATPPFFFDTTPDMDG